MATLLKAMEEALHFFKIMYLYICSHAVVLFGCVVCVLHRIFILLLSTSELSCEVMVLQLLLQGIPQFSNGMPTNCVCVCLPWQFSCVYVACMCVLLLYLSLHCHVWYGGNSQSCVLWPLNGWLPCND